MSDETETEIIDTETPIEEQEAPAPETEADEDAPMVIRVAGEEADDEDEDDDLALPEEAPKWAKKLRETAEDRRKRLRELERENRELKAKTAPEEKPALGPKPKLEDFDYDEDEHEKAMDAWYARKAVVEQEQTEARKAQEAAEQEWQAKVAAYQEGKAKLKVADFDDAEEVIQNAFSVDQQGIMLHVADNPTVLAYAIGKDPKRAATLAAIKDPIKFAVAVAKLEDKIEVTTRKPAAKPEAVVSSNTRAPSSVDNKLDALREEAARTGDYSKVMAYKRQLRG